MASSFDNIYLEEATLFTSEDEIIDFDNYQSSSFMPINAISSHTVSPIELMNDSAPASASFPNTYTPASSYLESPAMGSSSYNTSPLETLDSSLDCEVNNFPSLFPGEDASQFTQAPLANTMQNLSFTSAQTKSSSASPMVRQKSSPGRPPSSGSVHLRKQSLNHGIAKPGKPRKSLSEIKIEDNDSKEIAKRKKNTAAARKSRQRKQETQEALEAEIMRLRAIVSELGGNPDDEEYDQD